VGLGLWVFPRNREQRNAFTARELATRELGRHLASKFPGSRVLVLSNPFIPLDRANADVARMETAGINGLKEGAASKLNFEIAYPELTPEAQADPHAVLGDKETVTPLSFLVAEGAVDKVVAKHPQCDLVVSLIGLPADLENVQCWQAEGKPAFALLLPDLRLLGGARAVQHAVKRGKLTAFILNKPGAPDFRAPVRSELGEFEKRFLLVTPENIDEMIRTYPQLFATE
jgi:hypothetical protein